MTDFYFPFLRKIKIKKSHIYNPVIRGSSRRKLFFLGGGAIYTVGADVFADK